MLFYLRFSVYRLYVGRKGFGLVLLTDLIFKTCAISIFIYVAITGTLLTNLFYLLVLFFYIFNSFRDTFFLVYAIGQGFEKIILIFSLLKIF